MSDINALIIFYQNLEKVLSGDIGKSALIFVFILYTSINFIKFAVPKIKIIFQNTLLFRNENAPLKTKFFRLLAILTTMIYDLLLLFALIVFLRTSTFLMEEQTKTTTNSYALFLLSFMLCLLCFARFLYKKKHNRTWNYKDKSIFLSLIMFSLLPIEGIYISYSVSHFQFEPSLVKFFLFLELSLLSSIEYILLMQFKKNHYTSIILRMLDNIAFFISAISYIFVIYYLNMELIIFDIIYIATLVIGFVEVIYSEYILSKNNPVTATAHYQNKISNNITKIIKEKDFLCLYGKNKSKTYVRLNDIHFIHYSNLTSKTHACHKNIKVHCTNHTTYTFDEYASHNTKIGYYVFKKYNLNSIEYTIIFDDKVKLIENTLK